MADTIGAIGIPIVVDDSGLVQGLDQAGRRLDNFGRIAPKSVGGGFLSSVIGNANDATNKFENGVGGIATAFGTASHAAREFGQSLASGDIAGAFAGMASASGQVVSQMVGYGVLRHAVHALTSPVGLVAAGLTAVFVAGRNAIHAIADLNDTALKFGMTAEDYQQFSFALGMVGVDGEQAGAVMAKLRAKIGDLQAGEEGATKAFDRLGLDRQALAGKDTSEAMGLISDRLRGITDNNVRASIAMDIFGKQWHEIEEFALRGSGYFQEAAERAQRFGVVLSNDVVASLEATSDRADEMISAWGTVGTFVRNQFAIMMQPAVDALTPLLMKVREAIQPVLNVVGKLMSLAGGVVGKALSLIGSVLGPAIDGIGAVLGVIDKIITGIGYAFSFVGNIVGSIASWIGDKIGGAWDWVKEKAGGAWDWIKENGAGAWGFIKDKVGGFFSWLNEKTGGVGSWIMDKIGGAWDWVKEKAGDTWDWISDKAKGAWEWIKKTAGAGPSPSSGGANAATAGPSQAVIDDINKEVKKLEDSLNSFGLTAEEALIKRFQNAGASEGMLHTLKALQEQMKEAKVQQAVKDATKSIEEQAATIGMTATELQRYKLVAMGATEELEKFDAAVALLKKAQAEKEGSDFLNDLNKQIATFGMTSGQIKVQDLIDMGVDPAKIDRIRTAMETLEKLKENAKDWEEANKAADAFAQRGAQIRDSLKSPLTKLYEQFDDLRWQLAEGNITTDQYALSVANAVNQIDKLNEATASPTIALKGSAAAFSTILAANRQGERNSEDPQKRIARVVEQQRRLQELQLAEARRIAGAIEDIPRLQPAGGI